MAKRGHNPQWAALLQCQWSQHSRYYQPENSGNSPALSTSISPRVLVGSQPTANAADYREQLCQDSTQAILKNPQFGQTVFPGTGQYVQSFDVGLSKDQIDSHSALNEFPGSKFPKDVLLAASIVVCVTYRPSFNATFVYHTSYIAVIRKRRGSPLFKIGEDVN